MSIYRYPPRLDERLDQVRNSSSPRIRYRGLVQGGSFRTVDSIVPRTGVQPHRRSCRSVTIPAGNTPVSLDADALADIEKIRRGLAALLS